MNINNTQNALLKFTERYQQASFLNTGHAPKSEALYGIPSPCIIDEQAQTSELVVFWRSLLSEPRTLNIVEQVMNLQIHSDAHLFYGTQYAGDMQAKFGDLSLNLIQVWSDDDFSRLEQNLIAHLSMQKKLKRGPTIFIASTDDQTQIISIDNQTGKVVLEKLVENETVILTDNVTKFLDELIPVS